MVVQFALNRRFTPPPAIEELPPHNIEAEEAILGGCLLDPEAFQRCKNEGLESQMFYVKINQILFGIFEELSEQNQPTDFTTVSAFFQEEKVQCQKHGLDSALGREALGQYIMDTYTVHERWGDSWIFSSGGNTKFYLRHSLKESSIGVLDPTGDHLLGTRWIASTPEAIAEFLENAVSGKK